MFLLRILATVIPLVNTISAAAAPESEGIRIPIRRRDTIVKYDGSIDAQALRDEIAHVQTFVRCASSIMALCGLTNFMRMQALYSCFCQIRSEHGQTAPTRRRTQSHHPRTRYHACPRRHGNVYT